MKKCICFVCITLGGIFFTFPCHADSVIVRNFLPMQLKVDVWFAGGRSASGPMEYHEIVTGGRAFSAFGLPAIGFDINISSGQPGWTTGECTHAPEFIKLVGQDRTHCKFEVGRREQDNTFSRAKWEVKVKFVPSQWKVAHITVHLRP